MDKRNRKKLIVVLFALLIVLLIVGNALLLFGNESGNKVARIVGIVFLVAYVIIMIMALLYVGLTYVGLQKLKAANGNSEMNAPYAPQEDKSYKSPSEKQNRPTVPPHAGIICMVCACVLLAASVAVVISYFVIITFGEASYPFRLFTLIFSPTALIAALALFYTASYFRDNSRK